MGGGNNWTPQQQGSFLRANMPWLQRMNQVNQEGPFGSVSWSGGGDHVAQPRDTGGGDGAGIEPGGAGEVAEAMVSPPPPSAASTTPTPAPAAQAMQPPAQGANAKPSTGGPGKAAMPPSPRGSAGTVNGDGLAEMMAKAKRPGGM